MRRRKQKLEICRNYCSKGEKRQVAVLHRRLLLREPVFIYLFFNAEYNTQQVGMRCKTCDTSLK